MLGMYDRGDKDDRFQEEEEEVLTGGEGIDRVAIALVDSNSSC